MGTWVIFSFVIIKNYLIDSPFIIFISPMGKLKHDSDSDEGMDV
jgi:hypothetical protein